MTEIPLGEAEKKAAPFHNKSKAAILQEVLDNAKLNNPAKNIAPLEEEVKNQLKEDSQKK